MNKNTTVGLIKEFLTVTKNQTMSEMLRLKANDYMVQGLTESEVFAAVLNDVKDLNKLIKIDGLNETIEKYAKFEKTPTATVHTMMHECGLARSIKAIKESNIITDPVIKTTVTRVEEALKRVPEFKLIPNFIETLKPFAYDSTIKAAVTEAAEFMQKNATKLLVLNSIFEMKSVPSNIYGKVVSILEQALLDNNYSVDALSMQLRESTSIPTVKTLISNLSHVEGRQTGTLNLGLGNNNVMVESVIAPSINANGNVVVLLNNHLYNINESGVSFATKDEQISEFYNFCENYVRLGFKQSRDGIRASKLRNIELEMKNEGQSLNMYLNKTKISDPKKINYSELFIMENGGSRQFLASVFENLDQVNSLDFIKLLVAENKSAYTININNDTYVIENTNTPTITKMNKVQLHKYVLENFKYDMKSLLENELEGVDKEIDEIEKQKGHIKENIAKLEESIKSLDASLAKNLNEEDAAQVVDLKFVIEKQINAFKDKFVLLEAKKKKLYETQTISMGKNYNIDETVRLKDGRSGKVTGVDKHAGRYMIRTEDGKISPFKHGDID